MSDQKLPTKTGCIVCDTQRLMFSRTDTHGIAQCTNCGVPYQIYHYEGEGDGRRRVEKDPECIADAEWVPLLREYWQQTRRIIPSGCSFRGGQELASDQDQRAFGEWAKEQEFQVYLAGRNAALEAAREAAGMLRHGYHMKETSLAPARPFPWQIFDELDEAIRALKHTPESKDE